MSKIFFQSALVVLVFVAALDGKDTSAPPTPMPPTPMPPTPMPPTPKNTSAPTPKPAPPTPIPTTEVPMNWTRRPYSVENDRYKGTIAPYQVFMIIVVGLIFAVAALIFVLKRRESNDAIYNPM